MEMINQPNYDITNEDIIENMNKDEDINAEININIYRYKFIEEFTSELYKLSRMLNSYIYTVFLLWRYTTHNSSSLLAPKS